MMLATHQMQSSHVALPSRSLPWCRERKLERYISLLQVVPSAEGFTAQKHGFPLRLTVNYTQKFKPKRLYICSFKGNPQNEESFNGSSKFKHTKESSRISYVPQSSNLPELQDLSISGTTMSDDETLSRSQAIQKLFRHWLTLLWTEPEEQVASQQIKRGPSHEVLQPQKVTLVKGRSPVLKMVWKYFMGLDATIKVPLMIFAPMYLAVNLVYGGRVAKEMRPLWILGPLVMALYVKLIEGVVALYVATSKLTVQFCKDLPVYLVKFGKGAYDRVWALVTTDYKELRRRKREELQKWRDERWLDFVESIWPWYYRWTRFIQFF